MLWTFHSSLHTSPRSVALRAGRPNCGRAYPTLTYGSKIRRGGVAGSVALRAERPNCGRAYPTHSRMGLREVSPCGLGAQSMPVRERESVALWAEGGEHSSLFTLHFSPRSVALRAERPNCVRAYPTLTYGVAGSVALRAGSGERKQRARPCKIARIVQVPHFGRRDVADRYRKRVADIVFCAAIRNARTCSMLYALGTRLSAPATM
jgi:hypothetical protein